MILKEFIGYWMNMAESVKDQKDERRDELMSFFCYYIAFNHIFDGNCHKWKCNYCSDDIDNCSTCFEKRKIKYLIKITLPKFRDRGINFNPFYVLNEYSELLMNVKTDKHNQSIKVNFDVVYNDKSINNISELFCNIHQVRCNLFHGAKDMSTYRDQDLVKESSDILKLFLKAYLQLL